MSEFDGDRYLRHCSQSKMLSAEELAMCGVIVVLVLTGLDLLLTMAKIYEGGFVDANPIAQMSIDHGLEWGIIVFKTSAASFFGWVCLKNLHLTTTQVGVGFVALAHCMLTFHWFLIV